jgi:hypothetical protein
MNKKISAFTYYINRLITLPITDKSKQDEWETRLTIVKNNGDPTSMIHNPKTRLTIRTQNQKRQQEEETVSRRKWVTFTHSNPLIRRVTNLIKRTNLKVAFRATNTIQQLTEKQTYKDPSGIYKLKCNTCNGVYVGQSGRAINVRYKEHIRYTRTNNPKSAYATHILDNRHEYGTEENTLHLLHACQKGTRMDCWEALYIQTLHQRQVLITEQQVNDINPLFELTQTIAIPRTSRHSKHTPNTQHTRIHGKNVT